MGGCISSPGRTKVIHLVGKKDKTDKQAQMTRSTVKEGIFVRVVYGSHESVIDASEWKNMLHAVESIRCHLKLPDDQIIHLSVWDNASEQLVHPTAVLQLVKQYRVFCSTLDEND